MVKIYTAYFRPKRRVNNKIVSLGPHEASAVIAGVISMQFFVPSAGDLVLVRKASVDCVLPYDGKLNVE